jgi:hypothetical protein
MEQPRITSARARTPPANSRAVELPRLAALSHQGVETSVLPVSPAGAADAKRSPSAVQGMTLADYLLLPRGKRSTTLSPQLSLGRAQRLDFVCHDVTQRLRSAESPLLPPLGPAWRADDADGLAGREASSDDLARLFERVVADRTGSHGKGEEQSDAAARIMLSPRAVTAPAPPAVGPLEATAPNGRTSAPPEAPMVPGAVREPTPTSPTSPSAAISAALEGADPPSREDEAAQVGEAAALTLPHAVPPGDGPAPLPSPRQQPQQVPAPGRSGEPPSRGACGDVARQGSGQAARGEQPLAAASVAHRQLERVASPAQQGLGRSDSLNRAAALGECAASLTRGAR